MIILAALCSRLSRSCGRSGCSQDMARYVKRVTELPNRSTEVSRRKRGQSFIELALSRLHTRVSRADFRARCLNLGLCGFTRSGRYVGVRLAPKQVGDD